MIVEIHGLVDAQTLVREGIQRLGKFEGGAPPGWGKKWTFMLSRWKSRSQSPTESKMREVGDLVGVSWLAIAYALDEYWKEKGLAD